MTDAYLYVVAQVVCCGADRLVHAALMVRIAELLDYEEVALAIVPLEKETRLKWHTFNGVLVRMDSELDHDDLVSALQPHAIAPEHASQLALLLSDEAAPEFAELRNRWLELGALVMKKSVAKFERRAAELADWVRDIVAQRITEVH